MSEYMYGKTPYIEQMMWDVYNAAGPHGGRDVTQVIRHYNIPDGIKIAIVEKIKMSPFLTPIEIRGILEKLLQPIHMVKP